jgi:hypothetical protein
MRLIVAAILLPVFMWCFVCAILWAVEDEEYRRSRAGRAMPWVFAAPFVMGEVLAWLVWPN